MQGNSNSLVRLTTYSEDKIYLLVEPYTKEFLPNKGKVVDAAFYSERNIQVLQEIARKGKKINKQIK